MKHRGLYSVLIVAFIGAAILRTFVLEGFIVRGDSMSPSVESGNYILINKLAYVFSEPARGDVIVASPRDSKIKILKRIIGLPGERFSIEGDKVVIREERFDTGNILAEAYLALASTTPQGSEPIKLDPLEYFAMGDNRAVSADSRQLGPIDKWEIRGKVFGVIDLKKLTYKGL